MFDLKKMYYLAHPCTTGSQNVEQNRMDEKLAYYELCSKHPGIKLVRPLDLIPAGTGHHEAMQKCFKLLDACDAAIFAGAWMTSKGCKMEFDFCLENEKGIIEIGNIVQDEAV
ncbi:DUF4406 domain-containing protein [Eubacteriaceae bacterium ES2]|nr:DUF4406 domain-containing protein [Eubacteriaceae bacterium ES2]